MNDLQEIEQKSQSLLERGREIIVESPEQYEYAGQFILGCKDLISEIKRDFAEPKRKADEAHKAIVAWEKRALLPVEQGMALAQGAALGWKREQDRIAREEQVKREAEAAKRREEERLKEAEVLEQWGETEAAQEKLKEATIAPRPTKFESPVPKVQGLSTRKVWKARLVDPQAVKREYCQPDMTSINAKVRNFMALIRNPTQLQIERLAAEVGGIEVYEEEIVMGRSR